MATERARPILDLRTLHYTEPDFEGSPFELPRWREERMLRRLTELYGERSARESLAELKRIMRVHYAFKSPQLIEIERKLSPEERFSERDVILITYPDQMVGDDDEPPLRTLHHICRRHLHGVFNTIHLLPFFPYSSDRGFAVIDFENVNPTLGTWDDIAELKSDFQLMFDAVLNHVSSQHPWFREFRYGNPCFKDFFISFPSRDCIGPDEMRKIVRPRTSDLLTPVRTIEGVRYVWTTFSTDQIDLNYKNPRVLERMIETILYYVRRGADLIRLDAVTYLWWELGTPCAHLPQTHTIIKLIRDVIDAVAPRTALVTETNVPHEWNVTYFGDGTDEAHMVYNFALPPLVLWSFQKQDASRLTRWAAELRAPSRCTTFLNFLDSHDGIGVLGAQGILGEEEIEEMAVKTVERGGFVSYKDNGDGTVSPYELNITWESAINPDGTGEPEETNIKRYLASRSIALALAGVPGIYVHGLLGSKNDPEAVVTEQHKRGISRGKLEKSYFASLTEHDLSTAYRFLEMIKKRTAERAFHPNAPQRVLDAGPSFFTLLRSTEDGGEHILAVTNVTASRRRFSLPLPPEAARKEYWYDLFSGMFVEAREDGVIEFDLEPYDVVWMKSL